MPAIKVDYQNSMPAPYNPVRDKSHKVFEFMKTKHLNWKYENERRLMFHFSDHDNQFVKFKIQTLGQIIFGMRTSQLDRETIKSLVNDLYNSKGGYVKFFRAEPIDGEYAVKIVPD